MDYLKFENWKNSHIYTMQDLSFSKPFDIFIFTRFTNRKGETIESKHLLFADNIEEAIVYIRHIFLYDILNDILDDLNYDFKTPFDETQRNAISILNYWNKIRKIPTKPDNKKVLQMFCRDFNNEFSNRCDTEYEIHCLFGANELRRFLSSKFSDYEVFNKKLLYDICSNDFYAGYALKDFIDSLFK